MRFQTLLSSLRNFAIPLRSRVISRTATAPPLPRPGATVLRAAPTIPFLGSFFSSSPSHKMSYPDQRSDDAWRAVLSPG